MTRRRPPVLDIRARRLLDRAVLLCPGLVRLTFVDGTIQEVVLRDVRLRSGILGVGVGADGTSIRIDDVTDVADAEEVVTPPAYGRSIPEPQERA